MIGAGRAGIRSPSSDGLEPSTPGPMSMSTSAKSLHGDTRDRCPQADSQGYRALPGESPIRCPDTKAQSKHLGSKGEK